VALVKPIVVSGPFVAKLCRLRRWQNQYRFVRGSSISNQGRCETPAPIGIHIPNKHAAAIAPADLQLAVRFSQSEGIEHRHPYGAAPLSGVALCPDDANRRRLIDACPASQADDL